MSWQTALQSAGAVSPRLRIVPEYKESIGDVACAMCQMAGMKLDAWQEQSLIDLMAIDPRTGQWACLQFYEIVSRQNGKSGILNGRALAGLYLLRHPLIVWTSHEFKTTKESEVKLRQLIENLEDAGEIQKGLTKITEGHGNIMVRIQTPLDNGRRFDQRIRFIARSKSSGRGFTGDLNIIDEAFAYTREQQSAIMPTISARSMEKPGPQMLFTSTPPLSTDTGEVMHLAKTRALAARFNRSKLGRFGFRDWGIAGRDDEGNEVEICLDDIHKIDLDDVELWKQANPALEIRISEEFVREERQPSGLSPTEFARERLGVWPRAPLGAGSIDTEKWQELNDPDTRRVGDCALGIEVAVDHSAAAIGLYSRNLEGLGHTQLIASASGIRWVIGKVREVLNGLVDPDTGQSYVLSVAMGPNTYKAFESELLGMGVKIKCEEKGCEDRHRKQALIMGPRDITAACGHFVQAVEDKELRVRPDPRHPEILNAAVAGGILKKGHSSVQWMPKDGVSDVTPLNALTAARYGFTMTDGRVVEDHKPQAFFAGWR